MVMPGKSRLIAVVLFAVLATVLASGGKLFQRGAEVKTWGAVVTGLPDKVAAELADEDVPLYILKQTHEPLLRSNDGQNYFSKILLSWRRNINSSEYVFYPDPKVGFNENNPFTVKSLSAHLKAVTARFSGKFSIRSDNYCVTVKFERSRRGYVQFLSMYENSPTLRISDTIELGLGEFRVAEINKDYILLDRKKPCSNGYGKIIVYEASPDSLKDLQRPDIADINRIAWRVMPENTLKRFKAFDNIPLKSSGLVLVTPDKELRRIIYNCMDTQRLRNAVYPQKIGFNDISTILPVGIPGGSPGTPAQECRTDKARNKGKTAVLAAVDRNNGAQLQELADSFYSNTGVKLSIKLQSAGDLVKQLFKRPHPYDMVPIVFSVVQPEYETFFKDFSVKDGFLDYDLPKVAKLRKTLLESDDDQEKGALALKIANELAHETAVLPLYQEVRKFYYPAEIRNLSIGRGFTEYPEVADFRW